MTPFLYLTWSKECKESPFHFHCDQWVKQLRTVLMGLVMTATLTWWEQLHHGLRYLLCPQKRFLISLWPRETHCDKLNHSFYKGHHTTLSKWTFHQLFQFLVWK